jgi:hypothetical protein
MPVAVSSSIRDSPKGIKSFLHTLPLAKSWEGVKKRNKSEDLPNAKHKIYDLQDYG